MKRQHYLQANVGLKAKKPWIEKERGRRLKSKQAYGSICRQMSIEKQRG
jgi:hypothetical protein